MRNQPHTQHHSSTQSQNHPAWNKKDLGEVAKALGQLLDTIEQVKTKLNPLLKIMGILLTRSTHTLHAAEVEKRVRDIFTDHVFATVIGQSVRFEEAPAAGQTILDYETAHPGAQAYRTFAKEVLRYEETHRSP